MNSLSRSVTFITWGLREKSSQLEKYESPKRGVAFQRSSREEAELSSGLDCKKFKAYIIYNHMETISVKK